MDPDRLREELKDLHRGRGVRRAGTLAWLGPELREALALDPGTSDSAARDALVALLREHTAAFPRDLRYLFLVAAGVLVDAPMLADRLATAEKALDRSARVLRRRLRVAEELLTESLVRAGDRPPGPYDDQGWQWVEHEVALELRSTATVTLTRTLLALAPGPRYIHEAVVIPPFSDERAEVTFETVRGLTILDVDHGTPTTWGVTLRLPDGLRPGELLDTCLRVHVPEPRALAPCMALAPVRPARRARVVVDFGTAGWASRAWVLDGVLPTTLGVRPAAPEVIDVTANPVVARDFDRPRVGLAYGIGWEWS